MNDQELGVVLQFVGRRTGIVLTAEKRYLVETRLEPVARRMGLASLADLVARLRARDAAAERAVIDAMTTNETLFFRDKQPFETIRDMILPRLAAARRRQGRIRVWCAACSTGQEPYSIAMIADELRATLGAVAVEILGTDISEKVLEQAQAGVFSQFEVQRGLPIRLLLKHFTQEGTRWLLKPEIVAAVRFQTWNLLDPLQALGAFDLILCRNVMIYFDKATKTDLLRRIAAQLAPDGYLILGGAETVLGLDAPLAPHQVERGVYVHRASPEAAATARRASA